MKSKTKATKIICGKGEDNDFMELWRGWYARLSHNDNGKIGGSDKFPKYFAVYLSNHVCTGLKGTYNPTNSQPQFLHELSTADTEKANTFLTNNMGFNDGESNGIKFGCSTILIRRALVDAK